MRKRKSLLYLLLISFFSFAALLYLVFFFPPKFSLPLYSIEIPILPIAALAFFIFTWSISWFTLANKRRGAFISLAILIFLLLRFYKLNQALFPLLIIIFFVGLEILFREKKKL
ncbi:MAG: hypothetical protein A3B38_04130 [Candidatus Levybacteria bacterium RIFCSPLOWO2_01_FULL_36_13]|nr:MAG: hypothetical protein A2684_01055 [Candidatus Levybacteria bacterium RIFCSPHIGHO2_01_FULL_36_15b]OGH34314.1 MAG: hypothetical protein A3B38_04130 [Candidatus Levybacteria bacterium RIFCSPLOWO2_01_FULL_36_13]